MSRRTAVLCLYLLTAATSVAAILLPHVTTTFAAMLIFAQTLMVLGVVALLEQHPLPTTSVATVPVAAAPTPAATAPASPSSANAEGDAGVASTGVAQGIESR